MAFSLRAPSLLLLVGLLVLVSGCDSKEQKMRAQMIKPCVAISGNKEACGCSVDKLLDKYPFGSPEMNALTRNQPVSREVQSDLLRFAASCR